MGWPSTHFTPQNHHLLHSLVGVYGFPISKICTLGSLKLGEDGSLKPHIGTFLAVQWLRRHASKAGVQVQILVRKLRPHMCLGQKTKTQHNIVL